VSLPKSGELRSWEEVFITVEKEGGAGNPVTSTAGQYVIGKWSTDLARNWGGYLEEF
jgi:hypothetical protein